MKPDQQTLNLLSAQDSEAVVSSDRSYNKQVSQINADDVAAAATTQVDAANQAWD